MNLRIRQDRRAFFVALLLSASTHPHKSMAGESQEFWYDLILQGTKVGYLHSEDRPASYKGRPAIRMSRRTVMRIKRLESEITMETRYVGYVDERIKPLAYSSVRMLGAQEERVVGKVVEDKLEITTTLAGVESKRVLELPLGTYLGNSLDLLYRDRLKPGYREKFSVVMEELGQVAEARVEVVGPQEIEHRGERIRATLVKGIVLGVETREWLDEEGRVLRVRIPSMNMELHEVPKEQALSFGELKDLFSASLLKPGTELPPPEQLRSLTLRLSGRGDWSPKSLIADRFQRELKREGGSVLIEVHRRSFDGGGAAKLPIKEARLAKFLAATPHEQVNHPEVEEVASRVVGEERDAWQAAIKISRFVHLFITEKSLRRPYSSALEVLRDREGDCTEHSILFSALAKAAGLPTRLVNGLVYLHGAFGYHEWVEVYLGERAGWVPLDPTLDQITLDPTHLKFTVGTSDSKGLLDAGIAAAELFANLSIEVVGYQTLATEER